MSGVRVAVAMGWPVHRSALATALAAHLEVVGAAGDVAEAASLVAARAPDVVLVELDLPGGGPELCAALKEDGSPARVLVLGRHGTDDELVEAVHAGADGYLAEDAGLDALVGALARVGRGEASIPTDMLGGLLRTLISDRREEDAALERFGRLSRREREILVLVVDGLDNDSIAERLVLSPNTARTHVQNILRKLEVRSRLEAASLVTRFGLLDRFPVTAS